jgi:serine/threonine protein kinase
MSTDPEAGTPRGDVEKLTFSKVTGETVQTMASVGPDEAAAPEFLAARPVRLADGTELRQVRVTDAGTARKTGYERLDNEILAGIRLQEAAKAAGYPPEVSRLYGYEATSAAPFALLEPYRGEPLTVAGQYLMGNEQHQFQVSLLRGLCWLAAAGIAHRGIAPSTVRWDGQQAQVIDFSLATVIGAPREVIGTPPWAAREQRPGTACGWVSAQDDIWAAGRLIFYMSTREELTDRSQIEDRPALRNLLAEVFGPPEGRPTARDLLRRLNEDCPVPRALDGHSWLNMGRQSFYAVRASKHPGIAADAGDGASPGRADAIWEPPGQPTAPPDAVIPQVPPQDSNAAGRPRSGRGLLWRSR